MVISEYQWLQQIQASCCCCHAAGLASWKEPKKAQRQPGLKTGEHSEHVTLCTGGYKNISEKQYNCLWNDSSFWKSLRGCWKAPAPPWHMLALISLTEVDYGTILHTWTQLLIFLHFSKNNSLYIWRSDVSDVHSLHSCITSQAPVNQLCSYETGRQVLLHFTDGVCKARD